MNCVEGCSVVVLKFLCSKIISSAYQYINTPAHQHINTPTHKNESSYFRYGRFTD